jgi:hypothetical protein
MLTVIINDRSVLDKTQRFLQLMLDTSMIFTDQLLMLHFIRKVCCAGVKLFALSPSELNVYLLAIKNLK